MRSAEGSVSPLAGRAMKWVRALYHGEVRYIDDRVGRFLSHSEGSRSIRGCTLIVFTSDHGEEHYEHRRDRPRPLAL